MDESIAGQTQIPPPLARIIITAIRQARTVPLLTTRLDRDLNHDWQARLALGHSCCCTRDKAVVLGLCNRSLHIIRIHSLQYMRLRIPIGRSFNKAPSSAGSDLATRSQP